VHGRPAQGTASLEPARTFGSASDPWLDEAESASFDQSPPDDWDAGA